MSVWPGYRVLPRLQSSVSLPRLASDGIEQQATARYAFVRRMWQRFPGHEHYYLAADGTLEVWGLVDGQKNWDEFLDTESDAK